MWHWKKGQFHTYAFEFFMKATRRLQTCCISSRQVVDGPILTHSDISSSTFHPQISVNAKQDLEQTLASANQMDI